MRVVTEQNRAKQSHVVGCCCWYVVPAGPDFFGCLSVGYWIKLATSCVLQDQIFEKNGSPVQGHKSC